jgi:acyl-CoA thioesterase FadM
MQPTTLVALEATGRLVYGRAHITVSVLPSWVVEGEDRLSYTTLVRLVECCREYHWRCDIASLVGAQPLDSICRSLTANFERPVLIGSVIEIFYSVVAVSKRSYELRFDVRTAAQGVRCATVNISSVFYDANAKAATAPPREVLERLRQLQSAEAPSNGLRE